MYNDKKVIMQKSTLLPVIGMLLLFSGCGIKQSDYDKLVLKCDSLQTVLSQQDSTLHQLRDSIFILSYPSEQRYAKILKLISEQNLDSALNEISALKKVFPHSKEALASNEQIEYITQKKLELKAEEERRKALGFKVFSDKSNISIIDDDKIIKCSFTGFNYGKTFTFDYCEDVEEYHYRTADKDNTFILVSMTMSTKEKYAYPPRISVCRIENGHLKELSGFSREYATWTSYGAMIGNYSDDSHDFSKVNSIRYKLAAEISIEDSKRPLVIITKKDGNGGIKYNDSLSVNDVHNDYYVIKILNRNKL